MGGRARAILACALGASAVAYACLPDVTLPARTQVSACGDGFTQISLGEECDPGPEHAPGCTQSCRLACDGGVVDPRTNHCYFLGGTSATLKGAQSACAEGSHLVTFVSADELAFVTTRVLVDAGASFVDLTRVATDAAPFFQTGTAEPGWSRACPGCYANNGAGNPARFPVPDGGVDGPCVVFSALSQGAWLASPCDLTASNLELPVVCEREPPGRALAPCDAGSCIELQPTIGDKLYVFFASPAAYDAASSACAALLPMFPEATKASLVVLETREEREELTRAIAETDAGDFLLGLAPVSGLLVWADGVPSNNGLYPRPWAAGEPSTLAPAHVTIDDRYDTRHARTDALAHPFVCEIKLR